MPKILYREYDNEGNLIKKECGKCGKIKTVDNFTKNKCKKDGYVTECKSCDKQYRESHKEERSKINRQYYENHKEEICEKQRQYCENNKEEISKKRRQHYENNKEEIYEKRRQYYENNKEEIYERNRQYYENNKEEICEKSRQYYENNKEERSKTNRQYYENHKEEICEKQRQYRESFVNEEILRIYENVTKKRYPHNGIQYGIIYGIHCIPIDKWYIGQTIYTFNIRYDGNFFKYKVGELSEDNKKAQLLQEDIEKYGKESFEIFEVIDVAFSERELDEKEAYYIDLYKAYDEGYNSNRGNIFKHNKLKRREENDYQREGISRIC